MHAKAVAEIGSRRELFVDRYLVDRLAGVEFKLHAPQLTPPAAGPACGHYMTVLMDGDRYRAYFRQYDPVYRGDLYDGHPGELTCCAESRDGAEWSPPEGGPDGAGGLPTSRCVLRQPPFSHNFAPFIDASPAADPAARYKALAGTHAAHAGGSNGLHAFRSADGLRWEPMAAAAVVTHADFAFDSQNVSFWSPAEGCYVCYFRTWQTPHGRLRTVSRTTSADFMNWTEPVPMEPNLPGEHLYTSQTHPYFRAPHLYVALPTRFLPDRGDSTDILFMATRAGTTRYERLFTEAFILPGLDPRRWGNRSNYAACGVVPTGPAEMSLYHGPAGRRYTLRTDGFVSLRAGYGGGTMTTKPFTFAGAELSLNVATSAAGGVRIELQDEAGRPLPGRSLAEADEIVGDAIARRVTWRGDGDVSAWTGRPVRLHAALREADLYSLAFGPSFHGPAAPAMKAYFETLAGAGADGTCPGKGDANLERAFTDELVGALRPAVEQAQAAVRGREPYERRLAPVVAGYDVARRTRELLNVLPELGPEETARRLDELERDVLRFDPSEVFGLGPAMYPPIAERWKAFRKVLTAQAGWMAAAFDDARIVQNLDKRWRFQTDPRDAGLGAGWMNAGFDAAAWPVVDADRWWQQQGHPDYHGVAWYRRSFDPPPAASGRRIVLYFGAVDGDATVFVDGRSVGEHRLLANGRGWDQPFHCDVTDRLAAGRPALVAVRVRKEDHMGGMFRGVKLLAARGLKA